MNTLNSAVERFDSSVSNLMSYVDNNEYISAALALFLVLYASLAAPKLPEYIARLFENPIFKLLIFFLIAYSAKKNPTVAIIAAIGLMVSLHTLNRFKVNKKMLSMIRQEEAMNAELNSINYQDNYEAQGEHMSDEEIAMIEQQAMAEHEIPQESLAEMEEGVEEEVGAPIIDGATNANGYPFRNTECTRKSNFRNSFYPQYVNMKPDAYLSRYTGNEVGGYDLSARYSGSGGGRSTYGSNRKSYNGVRGSYN